MKWFNRLRQGRRTTVLLFIVICGIAGAATVLLTHAATTSVSSEAELGTKSGTVSTISDSTASGNGAVKFGVAASTTWPDATNTGVPAGTSLTTYSGPTTIRSCGVVIDSKVINSGIDILVGNGTHTASTPCVTIKNSKINGAVSVGYSTQNYGPLVITDTEINAGPDDSTAVLSQNNIFGWRLNLYGGETGLNCDGYCELYDSWVHNMLLVDPWSAHLDAILQNSSQGVTVYRHNTLDCVGDIVGSPKSTTGGCSSDIGLFGDGSAIQDVTVDDNFLRGTNGQSAYCLYSGSVSIKNYPHASNVHITNNVFEKGSNGQCGEYGSNAAYEAANGNVWTNNTWDSGGAVLPAGS